MHSRLPRPGRLGGRILEQGKGLTRGLPSVNVIWEFGGATWVKLGIQSGPALSR